MKTTSSGDVMLVVGHAIAAFGYDYPMNFLDRLCERFTVVFFVVVIILS